DNKPSLGRFLAQSAGRHGPVGEGNRRCDLKAQRVVLLDAFKAGAAAHSRTLRRVRPNPTASTSPPLFKIAAQSTSRIFANSSGLSPTPTQAARRDTAAIWGSASEIFAGFTSGLATAAARAFTAVLSSASLWRQRGPLVAHSLSRAVLAVSTA